MTKWTRNLRKDKIIILGSRAATSLVHKCLLLTGLLNWGLWSLHTHDSEPPEVRMNLWFKYPKINMDKIIPKYKWEICKCPELIFLIKEFIKIYPNSKIIKLDRPLMERINSHIKIWEDGLWKNLVSKSKAFQQIFIDEFGFVPKDYKTVVFWNVLKEKKEEEFLAEYPKELVLRINFHDLMNDFDTEMKKIADFIDVPFDVYKELWNVMRSIKHMDTKTKIKKYITL